VKQDITLRGTIVGTPKTRTSREGSVFLTMRVMASTNRKDAAGGVVRVGGMGFDVLVFQPDMVRSILATTHLSDKVKVRVDGKLEFEDWSKNEKSGTNLKVIADDVACLFVGQRITVETTPGFADPEEPEGRPPAHDPIRAALP